MSLAPSEQLTLEFQTSQRRFLEQTRVDSVEEMTSTESITGRQRSPKFARSSSKTRNWHIDGTGSFSIGTPKINVGLDLSGGLSESVIQTSQSSLEHITEATKKSSNSLKTLHKIEVRGISEGLIQNRMTRIIKNPYPDRTLSLNVFQLIKHFSVLTQLAEVRPALIIQVNDLVFDNDFVQSNSDFLRETLLDQSLLDQLDFAVQGTKILILQGRQEALEIAKLALEFLYEVPNIFKVPPLITNSDPDNPVDANIPETSFDLLKDLPYLIWIFTNLDLSLPETTIW